MRRHFALSALLITVLFSGCGTKGPLTHPPKPATSGATAPVQATPAVNSNDLNTAKESAR